MNIIRQILLPILQPVSSVQGGQSTADYPILGSFDIFISLLFLLRRRSERRLSLGSQGSQWRNLEQVRPIEWRSSHWWALFVGETLACHRLSLIRDWQFIIFGENRHFDPFSSGCLFFSGVGRRALMQTPKSPSRHVQLVQH